MNRSTVAGDTLEVEVLNFEHKGWGWIGFGGGLLSYGRDGIRVNAIAPGWIESARTPAFLDSLHRPCRSEAAGRFRYSSPSYGQTRSCSFFPISEYMPGFADVL